MKELTQRQDIVGGASAVELSPGAARVGAAGTIGAAWGVVGQLALLGEPVRHMLPVTREGLSAETTGPVDWLLAAASVALLGFFQGYRGLQRRYAPLVVGRAFHLARNPRPLYVLLAPVYCMGLLHASRRRQLANGMLLLTMFLLAFAVGNVPQPYRAIVDAGVVFGLSWGAATILALSVRGLAGDPPRGPLDLPSTATSALRDVTRRAA